MLWSLNSDIDGHGGQIGIMRAFDHEYGVFDPLDNTVGHAISADIDLPMDVAVMTNGSSARVYYVAMRYATRPIPEECTGHHGYCGSVRSVEWDGDESVGFSQEYRMHKSSPRHIAVSPDSRSLFITRSEGDDILVWNIADGAFEVHGTTKTITGVLSPISMHIP